MAMLRSWEDARAEGRADALLTVLHARGIAVTDLARERILTQKDPEQMKRWLEKRRGCFYDGRGHRRLEVNTAPEGCGSCPYSM
jgi:hypothetical protein